MIEKNDEQAIIPMERYNELLKKEEIFNENSTQLSFWIGSWSVANLIWFKGDEASKRLIEEIKTAYKQKKDIEEKFEELERKLIHTEWELQRLENISKELESKWWYKLFY